MADDNIDPQELERVFSSFSNMMDEFQRSGSLNVDAFIQLQKQNSKFQAGIAAAEAKLKIFGESLAGKTLKAVGAFGKTVGDSAMQARKNRESFASLNPIIDGAAAALSAIPIAGEALGKTLSTVGKFVTTELDESVKAFQKLGSVGGIGAEGVTGLRKSAEQAGLSFQQLSGVVSNSSSSLAFAFGSTASGLKQIANLTQAAEPFRNQLLALGFNLEQQSEVFADYIDRSARLDNIQNRSVMSLARGSAEYAKNLADLSRITGMSNDAAQSELDAQMSNIRFRRSLTGIDEQVAKAVSNVGVVIAGLGKDPQLTQGFQDAVAGYGTEAARNFGIATRGVGPEVAQQLKQGLISEQEAMRRIQESLRNTYESLPAQVFGVGTAFDATAVGMANLATAQIDYNKALEQGKKAADATDTATQSMVNAQLALQRFATEADAFVNANVFPNATAVIEKLVSGLDHLASGINKIAGTRASGGPVVGGSPYIVGEQGPEIVVPGANSTVLNSQQAQSTFDMLMKAKVSTVGGGYGRGFLPGIGFVDKSIMAGGEVARLTGFQGETLAEASKYSAAGLTGMQVKTGNQTFANAKYQYGDYNMTSGMQSFSGPGSYYNSIMSGVTPSAGTSITSGLGDDQKTVSASNAQLIELQQTMAAALSEIVNNTRAGADTSKKLLRASTS